MPIALTPAKAAILLGTSDRTVRSLIQRRILPATAVGRRMDGRQGPVRYEIALEDLHASGLPLDLARLPLIATLSRSAKGSEQGQTRQDDMQPLVQALKEEQARVQALRGELEEALQKVQSQLTRLEAIEASPTSGISQPRRRRLTPTPTHTFTQHAGATLIEGPPSGLIPLWMSDFGTRIRHNSKRHLLLIDNSIVALTPTEYRLALEILTQYAEWQTRAQRGHFVGDLTQLQQTHHFASLPLLRKHLRNVKAKLAPFTLHVIWGPGNSYTLLLDDAAPGTTGRWMGKEPHERHLV